MDNEQSLLREDTDTEVEEVVTQQIYEISFGTLNDETVTEESSVKEEEQIEELITDFDEAQSTEEPNELQSTKYTYRATYFALNIFTTLDEI